MSNISMNDLESGFKQETMRGQRGTLPVMAL